MPQITDICQQIKTPKLFSMRIKKLISEKNIKLNPKENPRLEFKAINIVKKN